MPAASIVSVAVATAALVINGLVGLGVEGSKTTKIPGVFAAGWLTLMEGLGFFALYGFASFAHGLEFGIGFVVIGLGIISLPIVHREFQRATANR